jgi:hypothetical protein
MTAATEHLKVATMGRRHGVPPVRHQPTQLSARAAQPLFAALHIQSQFRSAHCGTSRADSAILTARETPPAGCTLLATYKCTLKRLKAFSAAHHAEQFTACAVAAVG